MTEFQIAAELEKLKSEPRYTTVKGVDTQFYVTVFNIDARNVNITTTIGKHVDDPAIKPKAEISHQP